MKKILFSILIGSLIFAGSIGAAFAEDEIDLSLFIIGIWDTASYNNGGNGEAGRIIFYADNSFEVEGDLPVIPYYTGDSGTGTYMVFDGIIQVKMDGDNPWGEGQPALPGWFFPLTIRENYISVTRFGNQAIFKRVIKTTAILTNTSPNLTINAGTDALVYGTASSNQITLASGAKAKLINFPGVNTITIHSDLSLFTVFRSGATVTFEGTDSTVLKIPATLDSQTIVFNDGSGSLVIDSGKVMLENQEISLTPSTIN